MTIHQGKIEKRDLKYLITYPPDSNISPLRMFDDWNGGATKFGAYYIDPADNPTDHIYNQFCLDYGYKSFQNLDHSKMSHIHINQSNNTPSCIASLSFVYNADPTRSYYYTIFFNTALQGVFTDALACNLTENNQSIIDHPLSRPSESFNNMQSWSFWNWFFLVIIIVIVVYFIYHLAQ